MKQCERGHFYDDGRYSSCPYCETAAAGAGAGKTVGLDGAGGAGKTVSVQQASAPQERGKTVGLIKKSIGLDPAVGFAICTEGPHKGEDFKLRAGRNFIGRSSQMDVALPDDDTVSRENHALISYDTKNNAFLLIAGHGRGLTYCNKAQVEATLELNAYDVIEVGSSTLIFLPFCGERFQWE